MPAVTNRQMEASDCGPSHALTYRDALVKIKSRNISRKYGPYYFIPCHVTISSSCHCSRTETILSGIIIRPHPDDPKSTRVTVLIQVDMKGLIPHPIANAFLSKSPAEWQNSLAKYYWNDYSKKGQQGEGKE